MPATTYTISFTQKSYNLAQQYGGLTGNSDPTERAHNDAYDAYRHTLMSAELTGKFGADVAKWLMDNHEKENPNPPSETNMDKWNNGVGRDEYKKWKNAFDHGLTKDPLSKWIYDRVKQGKTINDLTDPRIWIEPINTDDWDDISPWNAHEGIHPSTNYEFQDAITPPRRDPLAIDLDGDGIETVGIGNPPILFDHNNDGIKTGTGWLNGDDAWLVMDRTAMA